MSQRRWSRALTVSRMMPLAFLEKDVVCEITSNSLGSSPYLASGFCYILSKPNKSVYGYGIIYHRISRRLPWRGLVVSFSCTDSHTEAQMQRESQSFCCKLSALCTPGYLRKSRYMSCSSSFWYLTVEESHEIQAAGLTKSFAWNSFSQIPILPISHNVSVCRNQMVEQSRNLQNRDRKVSVMKEVWRANQDVWILWGKTCAMWFLLFKIFI